MQPAVRVIADDFVKFLNKAVTPFHAVDECSQILKTAGFVELKEAETWRLKPLDKCFVTRNKSCLFAFVVGGNFKPGNGVSMVAAHTDSPCFKVKPMSKVKVDGCLQVGVSMYGGGLWRTWFDRDLTLAGRVIVKTSNGLEHRLIHIQRPILSMPNLAIHLETDREKFVFNKEDHLKPILATSFMDKQNGDVQKTVNSEEGDGSGGGAQLMVGEHHDALLSIVAEESGVKKEDLVDLDLSVIDTQPAAVTGLYGEFVSGGRLDNLVGTYTAIMGLVDSCGDPSALAICPNIRLAACFDNEEVGSGSAQGAESNVFEWLLRRIHAANGGGCAFEESMSKSFLISADQAHAAHPNYKAKHEENHRPAFHKGVVVKVNANQRYATTPATSAVLKLVAKKADVPLQMFVVRNDSPCGSTIGPALSARLGVRTVDVGTAQLAMHSVRELTDATGLYHARLLYKVRTITASFSPGRFGPGSFSPAEHSVPRTIQSWTVQSWTI